MAAIDIDPTIPKPFGAQRRRSVVPLVFSAGIFLGWFAFLAVLAATASRK